MQPAGFVAHHHGPHPTSNAPSFDPNHPERYRKVCFYATKSPKANPRNVLSYNRLLEKNEKHTNDVLDFDWETSLANKLDEVADEINHQGNAHDINNLFTTALHYINALPASSIRHGQNPANIAAQIHHAQQLYHAGNTANAVTALHNASNDVVKNHELHPPTYPTYNQRHGNIAAGVPPGGGHGGPGGGPGGHGGAPGSQGTTGGPRISGQDWRNLAAALGQSENQSQNRSSSSTAVNNAGATGYVRGYQHPNNQSQQQSDDDMFNGLQAFLDEDGGGIRRKPIDHKLGHMILHGKGPIDPRTGKALKPKQKKPVSVNPISIQQLRAESGIQKVSDVAVRDLQKRKAEDEQPAKKVPRAFDLRTKKGSDDYLATLSPMERKDKVIKAADKSERLWNEKKYLPKEQLRQEHESYMKYLEENLIKAGFRPERIDYMLNAADERFEELLHK